LLLNKNIAKRNVQISFFTLPGLFVWINVINFTE
jgi:hypothetical protein